jgi:hypothetical protein
MQREPMETGAAPDAASLQFRAQSEQVEPQRDDTTVSFDGTMKVTTDEAGGDPYNRTGSFKRLVR